MSSGDCATKALEHFHYLARYAWDRAKEVEALPRGITESLEILCKNVQKIRTLSRDKRLKKIGVFGPPKRGKSTLLNVFLGGEILPCGTSPTTRCAVEIYNTAGSDEPQRIVIQEEDGYSYLLHGVQEHLEFRDAIERCFSKNSRANRIEVYGNFQFGITPEKSVLVDTPGAESAFEDSDHANSMGIRGTELHNETVRALEMLSTVDIPLFCMRADQIGSETEKNFYHKYLRKLRPINVINFKDTCPDLEEAELIGEVVEAYQIIRRDTVLVSSREGLGSLSGKSEKKAISVIESSGFQRLSDLIYERLRAMEPEEGLRRAFEEYEVLVSERPELIAPKAYLDNFRLSVQNHAEMNEIIMRLSNWFLP
jgi:GTPase Era involved in 16S rRNA processing